MGPVIEGWGDKVRVRNACLYTAALDRARWAEWRRKRRGDLTMVPDEVILSDPDLIAEWYVQNVRYGAEFIVTPTGLSNSDVLKEYGLEHECRRINLSAAQMARSVLAEESRRIIVAGAVRPLLCDIDEDGSVQSGTPSVFHRQIEALIEGGVDLLLVENATSCDSLRLVLDAIHDVVGEQAYPIVVGVLAYQGGFLLSGETVTSGWDVAQEYGAIGYAVELRYSYSLSPDVAEYCASESHVPLMFSL